MQLFRCFSREPLVELRTDMASDRTTGGRPYLHFTELLEDGKVKRRMKALAEMSLEDAENFIWENLDFLTEVSGKSDAAERVHEFLAATGFAVRRNLGKPRPRDAQPPAPGPESMRRFVQKLAFWRKGAA
jgi:hypothetical protein